MQEKLNKVLKEYANDKITFKELDEILKANGIELIDNSYKIVAWVVIIVIAFCIAIICLPFIINWFN